MENRNNINDFFSTYENSFDFNLFDILILYARVDTYFIT